MADKAIITIHILAYLVIIITDVLTTVIPVQNLRAIKISTICNIASISLGTAIFGLIVNYLTTKIFAISENPASLASSLTTTVTPSDLVDQNRQSAHIA